MSLSLNCVVIDCLNPSPQAAFWSQVLGWSQEDWGEEHGAMVYNPDNTEIKIYFLPVPEGKIVKNRVHLDVRTGDNTMEAEVERLATLGAKELETKSLRTDQWTATWTIMGDPEGNEFCVSAEPTAISD